MYITLGIPQSLITNTLKAALSAIPSYRVAVPRHEQALLRYVHRRTQPQLVILADGWPTHPLLLGRDLLQALPACQAYYLTYTPHPLSTAFALRFGFRGIWSWADLNLTRLPDVLASGRDQPAYLSPQVEAAYLNSLGRLLKLRVLTPTLHEVLLLMHLGHTERQIAERLVCTRNNIHQAQRRLRQVLGVRSNADVLRYFVAQQEMVSDG